MRKFNILKVNLKKASAAYVADYRGYSVEQITTLRRLLQKENCDLTVTKNTLAKLQ
ncbi:MAG: 50S ribosomal protein L10 [Candidatus Melainabacteria bacterium]|nr:MAG: 50S ribosomal protein L10 [Candidatus Melainabacteria bacterium]